MQKVEFSDEDLTAFLDGEAEADLSRRIEAALAADAALSSRLDALSLPMDALAAAGDLALQDAPDFSGLEAKSSLSGQGFGWASAGLAAAALIVGVGIGSLVVRPAAPEPTPWIDAIVAYQVLYRPETIAASRQSAAETASVLAGFRSGGETSVEAARDIGDLTFARAQLLGLGDRALLQMAYATEAGVPIAICAVEVTGPDRGFTSELRDGLATTHWVSGGVGYLVVGGDDIDQTAAWAADVSERLSL